MAIYGEIEIVLVIIFETSGSHLSKYSDETLSIIKHTESSFSYMCDSYNVSLLMELSRTSFYSQFDD